MVTPDNAPAPTTASGTATTATTATATTHGPDQPATETATDAGSQGSGVKPAAVPIASVFSIKERVVFDYVVPNALNSYRRKNHGQGPPTHDQFMQNVIRLYRVELPDPPAGYKYLYDPTTEELQLVLAN